ncbi:zinc finger CCCH domain-containing protein 13-like isoform X2 [Bombus pascuorum]|nr:zinc finger CCCH domain-containing protein 13-like isoform X2 [Bombus pascuorum]
MQSQSACDCYCKTRVPIARQREEIQYARSGIRGSRSSVRRTETARSARKVTLAAAKAVDDEQLDSKRSSATLSDSPALSPETTAVLENVEKLVKDAQIQMKEISMSASCGRLQKCTDVEPDDSAFDDENDQLLYIRERVAYKFQEANGWIDAGSSDHRPGREQRDAIKAKRTVDLTAPKFQISDDRYEEFSRRRKRYVQRLSSSCPAPEDDECENEDRITRPPPEDTRRDDKRTNAFSVRMGPSVNIKGDLVTQSLASIRISPDPSFVQESRNVATYVVRRDFRGKDGSPRKREKVVRIAEDGESRTKGKSKRAGWKDRVESGDGSDAARVPRKSERVATKRSCDSLAKDEKLDDKLDEKLDDKWDEKLGDARETTAKDLESEGNLESMDRDDEVASKENSRETIEDISNDEPESEIIEEGTDDSAMKISARGNQKQVRFDERISERKESPEEEIAEDGSPPRAKNHESRVESQNTGGADAICEENSKTPLTFVERLQSRRASNDQPERFKGSSRKLRTNDEQVPLSSREVEEKHKTNKRRHKEVCEKRRTEEDERYEAMDKRFANIVQKYCNGDEKQRGNYAEDNVSSSSAIFTEESEESDDLCNLYEPSMDELDQVLLSYDKIIESVVRSTKTIDRFLSRPELDEYRAQDTTRGKPADLVAINSAKTATLETDGAENLFKQSTLADRFHARAKHSAVSKVKKNSTIRSEKFAKRNAAIELENCEFDQSTEMEVEERRDRTKSTIEDQRLPARNKANVNEERQLDRIERTKATTCLKSSVSTRDEDGSRRRCIAPRVSEKFTTRIFPTNSRTRDRPAPRRRTSNEETTGSSEDNSRNCETTTGTNEPRDIFPRRTRLFRIVNDSSSLTASSIWPQSSSTDTKSANDTKMSQDTWRSPTIKDESRDERATILGMNALELKEGEVQGGNFDDTTLRNIARPAVLKDVEAEERIEENLMARALREETRFVEDKIKNMPKVNEIAPLMAKSLLQSLKNDEVSRGNLQSLVSGKSSIYNAASNNVRMVGATKSDDESEKRDSQMEHARVETNLNEEIIEKDISMKVKSERDDAVLNESIPNTEDRSSLKCNVDISRNENSADKIDRDIGLAEDIKISGGIVNTKKEPEKNDENSISKKDANLRMEVSEKENKISTTTVSNIIHEPTRSKEYHVAETSRDNLLRNIDERMNLRNNEPAVKDIKKTSVKTNDDEDAKRDDLETWNERSVSSNDTIDKLKKEKSVELCSMENPGKNKQFDDNISQGLSSDSLRDCASLGSSSRNLSKTSSNNTKLSQEANEFKQMETNNAIVDKISNINNSRFDSLLEKKNILSDVYEGVDKKFFSSTCLDANTNYSSLLNQRQRLSNGTSTISTIESNKMEISSDTSHSEGELYMPSSGSYSLGEVRMLTKIRSDGENTDDFDNNVAIFVTKEMLTSWNESSKSLIQSMGEI